jgi:hypothetical protein
MTIVLHTNYGLDPNNLTFAGERDDLIKTAENLSLWLYSQGNPKGSPSGLNPGHDSLGRLVIGYGYDLLANIDSVYTELTAAGAIVTVTAVRLRGQVLQNHISSFHRTPLYTLLYYNFPPWQDHYAHHQP